MRKQWGYVLLALTNRYCVAQIKVIHNPYDTDDMGAILRDHISVLYSNLQTMLHFQKLQSCLHMQDTASIQHTNTASIQHIEIYSYINVYLSHKTQAFYSIKMSGLNETYHEKYEFSMITFHSQVQQLMTKWLIRVLCSDISKATLKGLTLFMFLNFIACSISRRMKRQTTIRHFCSSNLEMR